MNLQKRNIIEQIIKEANDAYMELDKSKKTKKDWEDFGKRLKGIYRSYHKANAMYSEAMCDILSGKRKNINPEIIDGNYGLRTIALTDKDTKNTLEIAKTISKVHGKENAKYYTIGVPASIAWACNELEERKKQVKENFKDAIDVVVKQTY